MVHREYGIGFIQVFGLEKGVGRQWPAEVHPLRPHLLKHRNDGVDLFSAHMSALTRVRIQAANQHMRLRNTEFGLQIVMQNANDLTQEFRRNGIRNGFDRQVRCYQRNAHCFGCQHHHHFRAVRTLFEKFGMPGKRNARVVDYAFMHRTGDRGCKFALKATVTGARQRLDNVVAVFDV